jgi:retinol dehydrogenase 12
MMKTALITGANSGIGFETAKALVKQNYNLILLVRDQKKADETKKVLQQNGNVLIESYLADLSNLVSVKKAVEAIKIKYKVIDVLINNAGYSANTIEIGDAGFEKSFITNHLGHFVLTNGLMDLVDSSNDGRIINVASEAYKWGKYETMFTKNDINMKLQLSYGNGKLANILFTKALITRLKNATTYCLHPGIVNTNFGSDYTGLYKLLITLMKPIMISPEQGAATSVYLATKDLNLLKKNNGDYFAKLVPKTLAIKNLNQSTIDEFWKKSEIAVSEILKNK